MTVVSKTFDGSVGAQAPGGQIDTFLEVKNIFYKVASAQDEHSGGAMGFVLAAAIQTPCTFE